MPEKLCGSQCIHYGFEYIDLLFCGLRLCDLPEQKEGVLFSLILLSMMIPTSSLVIPMFKMFNSMHLLNTKLGVVLPALSTAF